MIKNLKSERYKQLNELQTSDSIYETKHILKMKTVLQPFVLRRLKSELDIRQRY